ncbi:S-(+)-linalool synthase chloroplastic, partial [Dissostichus eleginoides]
MVVSQCALLLARTRYRKGVSHGCCDTVRGVFAPTLLSPTMTQPQEASTAPPSHVPWLASTLEMEGMHHLWLCPLSSGRIYRHVWQSPVSMVKSLFWRPCSSRGPLKPGWQHFTQIEVNLQYAVGLSSKHLVDHQTAVTSGPAPVLALSDQYASSRSDLQNGCGGSGQWAYGLGGGVEVGDSE